MMTGEIQAILMAVNPAFRVWLLSSGELRWSVRFGCMPYDDSTTVYHQFSSFDYPAGTVLRLWPEAYVSVAGGTIPITRKFVLATTAQEETTWLN